MGRFKEGVELLIWHGEVCPFCDRIFGGGVEEIGDFWYNIGIKENEIREYDLLISRFRII